MFRPARKQELRLIALIVVAFLLSGCPGADETWALVKLLTKGEETVSTTETVEVRNCGGLPEKKIIQCSAGTDRNMSISLGGSIITGIQGTLDPSVATQLGFNRTSGQSLEIETPSAGFIAQYRITRNYRVISGRALARSSSGREQHIDYAFQADCALRIDSREDVSCDAQGQLPPSTVATPWATVRPSPMIPSTPVPSPERSTNVPPISQRTSPDQFIRDYYAAISARLYDQTWASLSDNFKKRRHCCNPDGSYKYQEYVSWWNSIESVDVLSARVENRGDSAVVVATLRYHKKNGGISDSTSTFVLVADGDTWLID
jgi:hypothetical protein